jgi:hypothetical protein
MHHALSNSGVISLATLLVATPACTEIPSPTQRVSGADAAPVDDAAVDAALPSCPIALNLHLRGAGTYFASGTEPKTGGWGNGGPFQPPDSEWLYVDAYAAGHADELRGHVVPLGSGKNATLATATHWLNVLRGCGAGSAVCSGGAYYPISGRVVATRIEPTAGTGFELQIRDAVLQRATLQKGELVFSGDASDCIVVYELWVAGKSISIDAACAANPNAYLECILAKDASDRHPD